MTCCQEMHEQLAGDCTDHADRFECPDAVVVAMQAGAIGLPVHDGGRSAILIDYCPWCGSRLPTFLRS